MINIELDIIDQFRKGKHMAQMHLYTAFYKRVYNACYRILYNSFEAENAMQESFLKAFSNIENYNESSPFEAWLVRIAINTSIDKLRKKELEIIPLNENINIETSDNEDDIWINITDKVDKVKAAINRLPETGRLVINLYLIEGYDHEEISDILNVAPGTIRIQYMRAKQKLVQLLKEEAI